MGIWQLIVWPLGLGQVYQVGPPLGPLVGPPLLGPHVDFPLDLPYLFYLSVIQWKSSLDDMFV